MSELSNIEDARIPKKSREFTDKERLDMEARDQYSSKPASSLDSERTANNPTNPPERFAKNADVVVVAPIPQAPPEKPS